MLDKKNQKYFDYLVSLQVARFTGSVKFNLHEGSIGNADQKSRPMQGVEQRERVRL